MILKPSGKWKFSRKVCRKEGYEHVRKYVEKNDMKYKTTRILSAYLSVVSPYLPVLLLS
jgi:hypothetical protein